MLSRASQAMGVEILAGRAHREGEDVVEEEDETRRPELMVSYGSEDKTMRLAFFALQTVLASLQDLADVVPDSGLGGSERG